MLYTKGTPEPIVTIYKTPPRVGEYYDEKKKQKEENDLIIEGYAEESSYARDLCKKYPLLNE